MKILGTVKNVIHDGTILLGVSETAVGEMPGPGTPVFDQRGSEVGRVARVFGPVKAPYVSVRAINRAGTTELIGSSLYLDPDARPARKQGRAHAFVKRGGGRAGTPRKKGVKGYRRKEKPRRR